MSTQTTTLPRFLSAAKPPTGRKPERVDSLQLTEQVTGPMPQQTERSAADILAERLAEADPNAVSPSFVP
jgi:hypothetical protein